MSKEELKQRLSEADESVTWEEFTKWVAMCINASEVSK